MPGRYPTAKSTPLGQKETEQHTVGRKAAAVRGPCSKYAGLVDNSHPALPSGSSGQYGLPSGSSGQYGLGPYLPTMIPPAAK